MFLPLSWRNWLRQPSRIALMLGMGALSAASAEAAVAEAKLGDGLTRVPQQSAKNFGELRIWTEGGRIYLSEGDKDAQELSLADTLEARHLRQLLERDGAAVDSPRVLQHRIILVGGGGDGFHWAPAGNVDNPAKAKVPAKTISSPKNTDLRDINPRESVAAPSKTKISDAENRK